ncbi:small integral membrane protein 5 [Pseudophryne corroboree]|uniref:small integral membrane protein 5 n=1 Tax=Pseudophryne corroboree TaxID=495146 RepID=UPI0030821912
MSSQDVKAEIQDMGQKLLMKLQQLPQADTLEIVSFTIVIIFIAVVLLMAILGCSFCCCAKHRVTRVQPKTEL